MTWLLRLVVIHQHEPILLFRAPEHTQQTHVVRYQPDSLQIGHLHSESLSYLFDAAARFLAIASPRFPSASETAGSSFIAMPAATRTPYGTP